MFSFLNKKNKIKIKNITTSELEEELKIKRNKQFIDVRTKDEFRMKHIRGFINMPLHTLEKNQKKLKKEQPVYVICQSGNRSMNACHLLKELEFAQIINIKGGINAWKK